MEVRRPVNAAGHLTPRTRPSPWAKLSTYGSRRSVFRCALVVCASVFLGLLVSMGALLRHGTLHIAQTDFLSYYASFRLILEGHGGLIFDFHALGRVEAALTFPHTMKHGVLPYIYPPYFALALAPLSVLSFGAAYLVWSILNLALLSWVLAALRRYMHITRPESLLLWIATLSFLPVFMALVQGQVSILLLALVTISFLAARCRRDTVAGAALAVASIKPTYILPLLFVFLLRRRWRCLTSFAGTAFALAAVPLPLLGLSINQAYLHTLLAASHWQSGHAASTFAFFAPRQNHSFAGLAQLLLPHTAAGFATYLLDAAAFLVLLHCTLRSRNLELALGLAVVVGLLLSPHVFIHDLSVLILPVAVAVRYRAEGPGHLPVLLSALYISVLAGLVLVSVVPIQLSVIGMAALALWLAGALGRDGGTVHPHPVRRSVRERPATS